MSKNFEFLKSIGNISEETFRGLQLISEYKSIPAGTQIVKLNEVPVKIYMLVSGSIRCYMATEAGKEFNKSFYLPISFVGSLTALITRKPSSLIFETLADCKVYELNYYQLMKLCDKEPKLKALYTRILEGLFIKYEKRLVEMISLDATARYLQLLKQNPTIEDSISQYHIASYLGITAVQLSRIRKKINSY
ncbi:MAG: Crp/Fnr family transcriptional regulator [Flavobacteriaceae bacterium]|tara:strand:- start:1472 stop:2047 length:576 start_codon:yes stop_codon:yes gene_type:complete